MIEKFNIHIDSLQTDRTIRVYLPNSYNLDNTNENTRYPVLYMHDGQNVFRDEDAFGGVSLGMEDYLDKTDAEVIVVAIDLNAEGLGRFNEYCPWEHGSFSKQITEDNRSFGGKGEAYTEFIVHQLKPLIDAKYRTQDNRAFIAGISLGGLISAYAVCRYPHVFSRAAGISSAFLRNREEIEKLVIHSDLSSVERFYLDCGTMEGSNEQIRRAFLACNQAVYDILKEKVSTVRFEILDDAAHSYTYFRQRVPAMLSYLLQP